MSHGDRDRDLLAMKTRYWFKVLKLVAKQSNGFKGEDDKSFVRELETNPLYADVADWEWWEYLNGDQVPLSKRINVIEKLLPGTAESFNDGPRGWELWEVLAGNSKLVNRTFNDALVSVYGSKAVKGWDLGEKAFWFVLPMLSFKVAPFVAQIGLEKKNLPWSDIQHLIERGVVNVDRPIEGLRLSALLELCDDTRKLYTLEKTLADHGGEIVGYAYTPNDDDYEFGFTGNFILGAISLWWIAQENNNNRVKNVAQLLVRAMNNEVIELEFEEVGADLKDYISTKLI